jgi:hypothetical protein
MGCRAEMLRFGILKINDGSLANRETRVLRHDGSAPGSASARVEADPDPSKPYLYHRRIGYCIRAVVVSMPQAQLSQSPHAAAAN